MATAAIRLPDFGDVYDGTKMRAMVRTLESQLNRVRVGRRIPYGVFIDTADQTVAATTDAVAVVLNTEVYANGVSVLDNSKITVQEAGLYDFQFSAQLTNPDTQAHDISIWFQKNGTPEPDSNTQVTVPDKHGTVNGHAVAAWNYMTFMEAGEYIRIYWQSDSTLVFMETIAAQTSPSRPATPSMILTVSLISE